MAKAVPLRRRKILWVKTGWAKRYAGDKVDGNFPWVAQGEIGHETYNFEPSSNGTYYCYVPPQSKRYQPKNPSSHDWTVVCLAKHPKRKGIHIVGWYEDATLEGKYKYRPESPETGEAPQDGKEGNWLYSIRSRNAFLVPVGQRKRPFSHVSVRRGKYSFLDGPGVTRTANKDAVLRMIDNRLKALRSVAIANPNSEDWYDERDPLRGFGTPEHRREVEEAAEEFVVAHYAKQGYSCKDMTKKPVGYDFRFTKERKVLCVEVKGTSGSEERFFITRRERSTSRSRPEWRLAMVTSAKNPKPGLTIYTLDEFERHFELECLTYEGTPKPPEATA